MFKKGISGNPSGRPVGSKTRSTAELRRRLQEIVDNNLDTIQDDLAQLEPKERLQCLERFIRYVLPTMQSMEFKGEVEEKNSIQALVSKMANNYNPELKVSSGKE